MRFERRQVGDQAEFVVLDVDERMHAALERLAWQRGDRCWRRAFQAARADQLDRAFDNTQRLFEPMVRQAAGMDAVPWATALADVCASLGQAGVDWWLAGSAALAVRGAPVVPGDLDLIVSDADSVRVGDLMLEGLIEPVCAGEWDLSRWWGRAFAGARIEWAGGITAAADEPEITDFGLVAAAALDTISWRDWSVRVPPLALQRSVSARRGLDHRVAIIDQLLDRPATGR